MQWAKTAAVACPETTCVCVSDSESDIYDLFVAGLSINQPNLHLLVRAGQNRNTTEQQDWADQVRQTAKIADQSITIRARTAKIREGKSARSRSREGRIAELEIRKATIQEVQRVISSYCIRWQIEVYFKTLKSGCRIEHRRFEHVDRVLNAQAFYRVLNALAFYSVVAWRLMYLCHLGRECPELDCEVIFEPSEWRSVYTVLKLEIPVAGCPKLNEVIRAIARLGGFIDRKESDPGTQSLWIGLQRCYDLSNAWDAFGPGSKKFSTS